MKSEILIQCQIINVNFFKLFIFCRDSVFLEAVYTLQRLKTTFTPADKLDVIVAVFDAITRQNCAAGITWNMDVLLPVRNFYFFSLKPSIFFNNSYSMTFYSPIL